MHCASPFRPSPLPLNASVHLSILNESLSRALKSSRRIAFDWHIVQGRLQLNGGPDSTLVDVLRRPTTSRSSKPLAAVIHDEDKLRFQQCMRDAMKAEGQGDGILYEVELRLRDKDGQWRWIAISGKIVERDYTGRAVRMAGTFSDIDACKRHERKLTRIGELYAASCQISQMIARIRERKTLFEEICRITVEHGGFEMAWIGVVNKHNKQLVPEAAYGSRCAILQEIVISTDASRPEGRGVIGSALREKRARVCNHLMRTRNVKYCHEPPLHADFGAIGSFPFRLDETNFGSLNLYAKDDEHFDDDIVALLEEMAADISLALANYRHEACRKAKKTALIDSARRYRQLVELSPEAMFVCREGRFALLNDAACRLLGAREPVQLLGRRMIDFAQEAYHPLLDIHTQRLAGTVAPFVEQVWHRIDGSRCDVEVAATSLIYDGVQATQIVVRDITERKLRESLQLGQNKILNMVATGAALPDILTAIVHFVEEQAGRGICSIRPLAENRLYVHDCVSSDCVPAFTESPSSSMMDPAHGFLERVAFQFPPVDDDIAANNAKHGTRRSCTGLASQCKPKTCLSWPIFGKSRKLLGTLALCFTEDFAAMRIPSARKLQLLDVCANLAGIAMESRASEQKIHYLAHYDGLTSLPNRFLFKEYLEAALHTARRHNGKLAVFFLDLDKFKEINDTFGHDTGDAVLREIAVRMRDCLRHTDKIARMGGDEFYVLIEDLPNSRYAAEVAKKLLEVVSRPIMASNHVHYLSVSIGIGLYPEDGLDEQNLLKNADTAMYRAKEQGKNAYRFHSARAMEATI